ncbi:MAG: hypothetical protein L0Y39_07990 [Methylococcaceae bacterium]|nr:hypothetical protein [Methylococcaceae bacterium]
MIVSVHIPKTGGASFRSVLSQHYGDGLYLDYADRPIMEPQLGRKIRAVAGCFAARRRSQRYQCVHGHFLPIKYALLGGQNSYAVWLRDPVQRLLSRYYYHLRNNARRMRLGAVPRDISLDDFCRIERFHNTYAKYLWRMPLDRFAFVGITEFFDASLEVFRRKFGINPGIEIHRMNVYQGPGKHRDGYAVDIRLRDYLMRANAADVAIYEKGLEINRALQANFLG